jgi:hypothetical protein
MIPKSCQHEKKHNHEETLEGYIHRYTSHPRPLPKCHRRLSPFSAKSRKIPVNYRKYARHKKKKDKRTTNKMRLKWRLKTNRSKREKKKRFVAQKTGGIRYLSSLPKSSWHETKR